MKTLKNWTITVSSIKKGRDGFLSYFHYLKSQSKHNGQEIIELTGKRSAFNMVKRADSFNLVRKLNKGGRPSNYAWSAVFSYPFEVDNKTMRMIFKENMKKFYKYVSIKNDLNLSEEEVDKIISTETVGVVHRNGGVNNHIHTMIAKHFKPPNTDNNAQSIVSIDLTKKKYLNALKLINNDTINKVMGLEVFDYQVKSKETQTKRISKTKFKEKQVYEAKIKVKSNEADKLLDEINLHIQEYKAWANKNKKHDEELPKELTRALLQVKNGNTRRAAKTLESYSSPT